MVTGNCRLWLMILIVVVSSISGCGRSDRSKADQSKASPATSQPGKSPAGGLGTGQQPAAWIAASRSWGDTLHWTFDSASEHNQDGLFMRLRMTAAQDFIPGHYQDTHPFVCVLNMTLRPIPEWPLARGLAIDSVIFHDPVRNKKFPALPIIAAGRTYESQTVRTQFANGMKKPYVPELTENQLLHPTLYLHWDKRVIIATLPPVQVAFVRTEDEGTE